MDLSKTAYQEWVQTRIQAVRQAFTTYDALIAAGVDSVPDPQTATQISCPLHSPDRTPSARYYPRSGVRHDHVHCFTCKKSVDSIGLYAHFKGIRYMDALTELERKFHVRIPKRPDSPEIQDPVDRGANYVSNQWSDVPRMLSLIETKLSRIRGKCSLVDYVKFCRVIDAVAWDLEKLQSPTAGMSQVLKKTLVMIDEVGSLPDDFTDQPDLPS